MITQVTSPMPGKIAKILVNVGDQVTEDDELLTLEAMKMENPIFSTIDGTVQEIKVTEGQNVGAEQVLIIIS
ncbi:MAG: biotin/lipoyl-containing protein [Smithellaceae bacterium]|nr:biotin/lipoyl-containing protein [Smithellaceae bacterium]